MQKYIRHKVSQKEKTKDNSKWGRDFIDWIIPPYGGSINSPIDKEEVLQNYMLYNNQVDQQSLDRWCKPFGIDVGQFDESVLPFNKTYQKVNVLLGDELKRGADYKPILTSEKDIKEKTLELRERINAAVTAQMSAEITRAQMAMEGAEEEEINAKVEEIQSMYQIPDINQTNFLSEKEILRGKILDYAEFDGGLKKVKNLSFKHAILSDVECIYVGYENGKPKFKAINPINLFYQKSPETEYIQYADYAGTKIYVSRSEALEKYGDYFTKDQLERFEQGKSSRMPGGINSEGRIYYENSVDYRETRLMADASEVDLKRVGTYNNDTTTRGTADLIEVVHVEWRTLRKVIFLTTIDEFGDETVDIVDESYPIPKNAAKFPFMNKFGNKTDRYEWTDENTGMSYNAEEIWIPRIWEGTRIDGDIFVNVREKINQPLSTEDPFRKAKLGYHGIVYSSTNAKSTSLMSRMKPFQIMYFIAMDQISKMLSRNVGRQMAIDMAQLPKFNDKFGREDMELFLFYQSKGITFFNSMANSDGGAIPSTRGNAANTFDASLTPDILNMTQICSWLDLMIGEAVGVSKPREGQMAPNSNVTDNIQSIQQSVNITEIYFFMHDELWKEILTSYVDLFLVWAKDRLQSNPNNKELALQYMLSDGQIQTLMLSEDQLDDADIGLYVGYSGTAQQYRDKMEQLLLPLLQNEMEGAELISEVLKSAHEGSSPEEVHKMIKTITEKYQNRKQELQQQQAEHDEKMQQMQQEFQQQMHQNELDKIIIKEEEARKTALLVEQARQEGASNKMYFDSVAESLNASNKSNEMSQEASLRQQEIDLRSQELDIKREEVKVKASQKSNKT